MGGYSVTQKYSPRAPLQLFVQPQKPSKEKYCTCWPTHTGWWLQSARRIRCLSRHFDGPEFIEYTIARILRKLWLHCSSDISDGTDRIQPSNPLFDPGYRCLFMIFIRTFVLQVTIFYSNFSVRRTDGVYFPSPFSVTHSGWIFIAGAITVHFNQVNYLPNKTRTLGNKLFAQNKLLL